MSILPFGLFCSVDSKPLRSTIDYGTNQWKGGTFENEKMENFVERLQIRPVEAGRSRTLFIKNVRVLRTYSNYDFWFIGVFSQF
jgi:hypothetical protein